MERPRGGDLVKRVSPDQLEALAFTHPGSVIEADHEQGVSVLTVNGTTYYAALSDVSEPCS